MNPTDPIPANPQNEPELTQLMHRHLLGDLSPDELEILEQNLLSSPALREDYLRAVRIDAALQDETDEMSEASGKKNSQNKGWKIAAFAATIAFAATGLAWWSTLSSGDVVTTATPTQSATIATLGDDRGCIWEGEINARDNNRLAPGLLELKSGVAVIEFDGGARLALQGPAALELLDPKSALLERGEATVRCEEGLYSFSLLTPTSIVVDIGTEFGVAVEEDGASEIHVLDGEVEVTETSRGDQHHNYLLSEGNSLRMTQDGGGEEMAAPAREWVRDYTTEQDRVTRDTEPRLLAYDWFPKNPKEARLYDQGAGWRTIWWRSTQAPKRPFYFTGSDPFAARHGEPRLAMLVGGGVEVRRSLAEAIDPRKPQTIFLSFSLYRITPARTNDTGKLSEAIVMLRSTSDPTSLLGLALTGRDHLAALERGNADKSELPVNGRRPQFVIAKIEFDPHKGNKVSMISYDQTTTIPRQEPEHWALVTRRHFAQGEAPLDRIAIQARKSAFKFGEINLGNSWEAVVHPDDLGL